MDPNFTQMITFRSDHPETLVALAREWDELQASEDVMGFMGTRILADRDDPGRYVMIAEFGVVDPELSAAQEAFLNNSRAQTEEFAERFRAVSKGEPSGGTSTSCTARRSCSCLPIGAYNVSPHCSRRPCEVEPFGPPPRIRPGVRSREGNAMASVPPNERSRHGLAHLGRQGRAAVRFGSDSWDTCLAPMAGALMAAHRG